MTATIKTAVLKEATSSTDNITLGASGEIGVNGGSYGTSGQVMTSGGTGAAPSWQDLPEGFTTGKAIAMAIVFG